MPLFYKFSSESWKAGRCLITFFQFLSDRVGDSLRVMATTTISCPSCGSGISVLDAKGEQLVNCPGCKKTLEVDFGGGGGSSAGSAPPSPRSGGVGAGISSYQRLKSGEAKGVLSREDREQLETGGLGDLLFNPMEGIGRAFSGLGAAGSMIVAFLIVLVTAGSIWFLLLSAIAAANQSDFLELVKLIDISNHLSFAFMVFMVPLTLYLLLQMLAIGSRTTSPPWEIMAASAVVFLPWAVILGVIALIVILPTALNVIAAPFQILADFAKLGFSAPLTVGAWVLLIGIITLFMILIVHPILLTYSILRHSVGMSSTMAFIVSPFIPAMHFVLLLAVNNFVNSLDFLQFTDLKAITT
jgi:hypothetical protein